MSTHSLDVSGGRALTTRTNDPASTFASMPAKMGDDVQATLSGFRELRFELPENARIQRRRYVRKDVVYEGGKPVKRADAKEGESAYETVDVEHERLVVVVASLTLFGRTSNFPNDAAPESDAQGPQTYEGTPHTQISAKRWGDSDLHFLESGELLEERELREFLPTLDAETLAKIPTK